MYRKGHSNEGSKQGSCSGRLHLVLSKHESSILMVHLIRYACIRHHAPFVLASPQQTGRRVCEIHSMRHLALDGQHTPGRCSHRCKSAGGGGGPAGLAASGDASRGFKRDQPQTNLRSGNGFQASNIVSLSLTVTCCFGAWMPLGRPSWVPLNGDS